MDVEWVQEKLEAFIDLCEQSLTLRPADDCMPDLRRREATIRAIMNAIAPSLAKRFTLEWSDDNQVPEYEAKAQAERCLGLALDRADSGSPARAGLPESARRQVSSVGVGLRQDSVVVPALSPGCPSRSYVD